MKNQERGDYVPPANVVVQEQDQQDQHVICIVNKHDNTPGYLTLD